ncbi:MAG: pitrilysin family protein [Pseudomonadota bacterium]
MTTITETPNDTLKLTRLPNGVRVISDNMPGLSTVSVGIWVATGARYEPVALNGAAHMLEHMVFKGTSSRSAVQIASEVEAVGGQMNAYTTRDTTAFYIRLMAGDLPMAVDVLTDLLLNPTLDQEELDRERQVIIQEIGMTEDTPDDLIHDLFQATAYPDQALGRPILGSRETVRSISRDDLRDYLQKNYAAGRLVFSAAGDVDHDRLVEMVAAKLGDLPAPKGYDWAPANYQGGDHRRQDDLEQVHILFGFDSVGPKDDLFQASNVLSTLLGGGMSSRLFQEVREKRGLVYSVYSFASPSIDSALFGIYAGTGPEQVGELVQVTCDELVKLTADLTEEEIERAKAQARTGQMLALENAMSRADFWASQLLTFDRPILPEEIMAEIEAVDHTQLVQLVRTMLASPLTLTALGQLGGLEDYEHIQARLAA